MAGIEAITRSWASTKLEVCGCGFTRNYGRLLLTLMLQIFTKRLKAKLHSKWKPGKCLIKSCFFFFFSWCFEFNRSFIFYTGSLLHSHRALLQPIPAVLVTGATCKLHAEQTEAQLVDAAQLSTAATILNTGLFCQVVMELNVRA